MATTATALGITLMISILYMLHAACSIVVVVASSAREAPDLHAATANTATSDVQVVEAQALLDFKTGITNDPFGRLASWTIHVNNKSAAAQYPCSAAWNGIVCDARKQHVTGLNLGSFNLSGSISLSLALLPALSSLNLSDNLLHGSLPSGLFNLPHSPLRQLDLSSNFLNGSLPDSFATLPALLLLDLSSNNFIGEIPPSLAQCKALQELYLEKTGVSGRIPSQIWQLPALVELQIVGVDSSPLEASLPQVFASCHTIRGLELRNVIARRSAFPANLSGCNQLRYLFLDVIGLEGFIPAEFWQLPLLEVLVVQDTEVSTSIDNSGGSTSYKKPFKLHGSLPSSFRCCPTITGLTVKGVNLTGEIPPSLGQCTALQWIHLSHGSLEGEIPKTLGTLSNLEVLSLQSHMLRGTIPKELFQASGLIIIRLGDNIPLGGVIPREVGLLKKLQHLSLYTASLLGPLPEELCNCTQLQWLDLGWPKKNGGVGKILDCMAKLTNLQILAWQFNIIHEEVPMKVLSNLTNLQYLDLSWTVLIGRIPGELGKLSNLQHLGFRNNNLSGPIPLELENCTSLQTLRLSHNNLIGRIEPFDLSKMQQLTTFTVQQNNLVGGLPSNLTSSKNLVLFDVQRNRLSGALPSAHMRRNEDDATAVMGLMNLRVLSMGFNQFSGEIPEWVWKLPMLQVLDLSHNHFRGRMPMTVTDLNYFKQNQRWHLSQSTLYEEVPQVINGNFQILSYILNTRIFLDISNNSLDGKITDSFGELLGLTGLILSHNRIQGNIPESLGNLVNLDDLSLSHNKLTGSIPEELGQLRAGTVDLSFNRLEGPIPTANNFNTRHSRSNFEGNAGLCGDPLPVNCSDGKAPVTDDGVKEGGSGEDECRRICAVLDWIENFASPWALLISFPVGLLGGFYFSYHVGILSPGLRG